MPAKAGIQKPTAEAVAWTPAFAGVSASVFLCCQGGESPSDVKVVTHVAEGNCVAARLGGEKPEVNEQPAG